MGRPFFMAAQSQHLQPVTQLVPCRTEEPESAFVSGQTESAGEFASDDDLGPLFGLGQVVCVAAGILLAVKRCQRFVESFFGYIPLAVCPASYPKNDVTFLIESHCEFPFLF